jgi:pimeloyl-ACP methyl ester carboxylesterase
VNVQPLEFGGSGPLLYFLHANGYPPTCYLPLLASLANNYHVRAIVQRPLWPNSHPEELADWIPLTDDLLEYLDVRQTEPVIGVGHSMGGIALLRAALRSPQQFRAIILIDPVLFPPYIIRIWQIIRAMRLENYIHPLISVARNRRRKFDDLDRLFNGYRHKPIFKYMDDRALRAYIEGIACPDEMGYHLCYSPDWESRIYSTSTWHDMDIWRGLSGLKPRTVILRGMETDTFWASTGHLVQKKQPNIRVETLENTTHLLPLERPDGVSVLIQSFLKETL